MKKLFGMIALLFLVVSAHSAHAVTVYYQPTPYPASVIATMPDSATHFSEGWLLTDENWNPIQQNGSYLQQNNWLYVGGLNARYRYLTYFKFNLTGLPQHVASAYFWLVSAGTSSPYVSSPYAVCPNLSAWSAYSSWAAIPAVGQCVRWWYPAPVAWNWAGFWASGSGNQDWYNEWQNQNGTLANNGVMIYSENVTNGFDPFVSSQYPAPYGGARPMLQLSFTQPAGMPNFKMPVPGVLGPLKLTWRVTNEVGGYECTGSGASQGLWPDTAHQGKNYFSIDISWVNKDGNGVTSRYGEYNTPVLAAAGGTITGKAKVIDVGGNDVSDSRGYYITLDHGHGYQTRYLHLQGPAATKSGRLLAVNDLVKQGDQIGIMGKTGKYWDSSSQSWEPSATGVHVHINFWINGVGSSTSNLAYAVMEGLLLKSYQTECVNGTWIDFYNSTNTPTRN